MADAGVLTFGAQLPLLGWAFGFGRPKAATLAGDRAGVRRVRGCACGGVDAGIAPMARAARRRAQRHVLRGAAAAASAARASDHEHPHVGAVHVCAAGVSAVWPAAAQWSWTRLRHLAGASPGPDRDAGGPLPVGAGDDRAADPSYQRAAYLQLPLSLAIERTADQRDNDAGCDRGRADRGGRRWRAAWPRTLLKAVEESGEGATAAACEDAAPCAIARGFTRSPGPRQRPVRLRRRVVPRSQDRRRQPARGGRLGDGDGFGVDEVVHDDHVDGVAVGVGRAERLVAGGDPDAGDLLAGVGDRRRRTTACAPGAVPGVPCGTFSSDQRRVGQVEELDLRRVRPGRRRRTRRRRPRRWRAWRRRCRGART